MNHISNQFTPATLPLWRCGRPRTQRRCWSCSLPCAAAAGGTATRLVQRCPRAWWSVGWQSPRRWARRGLHRPPNPAQHQWCDLWRTCMKQRPVTSHLHTVSTQRLSCPWNHYPSACFCLIKVRLTIKCCRRSETMFRFTLVHYIGYIVILTLWLIYGKIQETYV